LTAFFTGGVEAALASLHLALRIAAPEHYAPDGPMVEALQQAEALVDFEYSWSGD